MHKRSFTDRCLERAAWVGGILGGILAVLTIVAVVPPRVGVPPPFSLPEVLGTTRLDDLGDCSPGVEVEEGRYCRFVVAGGSGGTFRVAEEGAYPPGQSVRQPSSAKVDWDGFNFTFQAVRLPEGSGTWRVLSAGMWHDIGGNDVNGNCQVGDVLQLGQFCVERTTGAPFRVYGADQLYRGDGRPLFESGYAVLYWFQDGTIPSTDNGLLMPERVELGCEEQDALAFVAQRIPELSSGEERRRGDPVQWEVLEVLDDNKVCIPTPVRTSEAAQAGDISSAGEQSVAIERESEPTQNDPSSAKTSQTKADATTVATETNGPKTGPDQRQTSSSKFSGKTVGDTVIQGSGSSSAFATLTQGEYTCEIDTSTSTAQDTRQVRIEINGGGDLDIRKETLGSGKKGLGRIQWHVSVNVESRVLTVMADTEEPDIKWAVRCTRLTP